MLLGVQEFINKPFFYTELESSVNKNIDLLINPRVIDTIDPVEYNAIFDTLLWLLVHFAYAKEEKFVIGQIGIVVPVAFSHFYFDRRK